MARPLILAALIAFSLPAHAAPRSKEQALLNAMLNKRHPDGKGPSSTSSARGYYRDASGDWRRR